MTVSYSHSTGASFNIKPTNSYLAGRPGMITKEKEPNWFESASLAQWFIFIFFKQKKNKGPNVRKTHITTNTIVVLRSPFFSFIIPAK